MTKEHIGYLLCVIALRMNFFPFPPHQNNTRGTSVVKKKDVLITKMLLTLSGIMLCNLAKMLLRKPTNQEENG